jgi:CheY-like chemotaxis protein
MKSRIHLAVVTLESIRPLCRGYEDPANWTIERTVVTCPECLRVGETEHATLTRPETGAVAGRRVVVIEDDHDTALALAEVLESGGHRVHVALTGRTGIELVGRLCPDVVICDIWLPDTDGYEVARTLRSVVKYAGRLVAFTGIGYRRNGDRAADAGFDVFLAKPAGGDALFRAVGAEPSGVRTDAKMA